MREYTPISSFLTPLPVPKHPHDYDWFRAQWEAKDFRAWVAGKSKRSDVTFDTHHRADEVLDSLDLGYGSSFLAEYEKGYVHEGVEFIDGSCLVAWAISEFVDSFHSNENTVRYFVLTPRDTRWEPTKYYPRKPIGHILPDGSIL